jgi:hypothetical protein
MQREDYITFIGQVQEDFLCGLLGPGKERTSSKAAEETSENLQPAVRMTECAFNTLMYQATQND